MFQRYVAIGDSTTEGMDDPDGAGGYRGWADRFATHVARAQPGHPLEYANLVIRGRTTARSGPSSCSRRWTSPTSPRSSPA